MTIVEVIEL